MVTPSPASPICWRFADRTLECRWQAGGEAILDRIPIEEDLMKRRTMVTAGIASAGVFGIVIASAAPPSKTGFDAEIVRHGQAMLEEGKKTFRYETFGSEAFWADALQLHKPIAGEKNAAAAPGVSPKTALSVGLKVDADALPDALKKQLAAGRVNLDDPATTIALLKLN